MRAILAKSFRDSRNTILWIGVGIAVYALFILAFFPTIYESQEEFAELLEAFPAEIMGMVSGGIEAANLNLADPATFLQIYLVIYVVLILGTMAMIQAFNAFTNAERDGTMDVLLSLPISRREMLMGRVANTALSVIIVLTVCLIVILGISSILDGFDIDTGRLIIGVYGMFLVVMAQAAFTYMLVSIIPSSRRWAGALAYGVFFGGYLIHSFSGSIEAMKPLMPLFIFDHYQFAQVIHDGWSLGNIAFLSVVTLACLGVAWWRIEHKELGV